jgi:hypothetical protein
MTGTFVNKLQGKGLIFCHSYSCFFSKIDSRKTIAISKIEGFTYDIPFTIK